MPETEPTVYVVDDDLGMLKSMELLFQTNKLPVRAFTSAEKFLLEYQPSYRGCIVLDLSMPGMDGMELQKELISRGSNLRIIFLSAHGSIPNAVTAMRAGAIDFLQKPVDPTVLIERVTDALSSVDTNVNQETEEEMETILKRFGHLTDRQVEILDLIVAGKLNKQIAAELNLSIKTVINHRANIIQRMRALNTADLVRMTMIARNAKSKM